MPVTSTQSPEKVRTTVRLPRPIYNESRWYVEKSVVSSETLNDFFVTAIVAYVKLLRRKQIDADFAGMAEDTNYQKEARLISEEFTQSDWEAFEIAEREP